MNRSIQSILGIYSFGFGLDVFGKVPVPLYKAFSKLEYAEEFCSGRVRFQAIENYKSIEDETRIDMSEGVGKARYPGESMVVDLAKKTISSVPGEEKIEVATPCKNNYIYCLSLPWGGAHDEGIEKFGEYIVKIKSPIAFLRGLSIAVRADSKLKHNPPRLEASRVKYDKGGRLLLKPGRSKASRMAWSQKPALFSSEREYRLHFSAGSPYELSSDGVYYIDMAEKYCFCEIYRT